MRVVRRFRFEAAHHLPRHEGKCREMHGHSYELIVTVERPVDEYSGMVIDFSDLKRVVRNFRFVAETYDMRIPVRGMQQALIDLSMLLAMWAASAHGVGNMYGSEDEVAVGRCRSSRSSR